MEEDREGSAEGNTFTVYTRKYAAARVCVVVDEGKADEDGRSRGEASSRLKKRRERQRTRRVGWLEGQVRGKRERQREKERE